MYTSSYSRTKLGLDGRSHRPRGKSCGYYMRIVFFFSSLIQSLIIVSLVLFLIYGQPEKSAEEKRVKELDQNFNRLTEVNVQLRKDKAELGSQLAARTKEKAAVEKELEKTKNEANATEFTLRTKLVNCERHIATTRSMTVRCPTPPMAPPVMVTSGREIEVLQSLSAQQRAMITLIEANFTQTVQYLTQERDVAIRERDTQHRETITLRRDNSLLKEQLSTYARKCKQDFSRSLDGIQTVTSSFLTRINNLFPHQLTFHLTCERQQEQMEKIRTSCTNLSRDVENKFQLYLDSVGNTVSQIQGLSSRLEVQNSQLTSDLQQCKASQTQAEADVQKQLKLKQTSHDEQMERLLNEQNHLREQKRQLEDGLSLRDRELHNLKEAVSAQPNCRGILQAVPQPFTRQTVSNWPHNGPGLRKPPTVR